MKTAILILFLGGTLMACQTRKKMFRPSAAVTPVPAQVYTQETIRDTMVIEAEPEPVQSEKVVRTHGTELMHYCVIVGSFIYEQNAVNLQDKLVQLGFLCTSIMQNDEGMYRVSAECDNSHQDAWQEVCRIRRLYPQFHDAWLLEVKE